VLAKLLRAIARSNFCYCIRRLSASQIRSRYTFQVRLSLPARL